MPFKSKAQRRACYAKKDPNWDCSEFEKGTPKKLPERVKESFTSFGDWVSLREANDQDVSKQAQ